MAYDNLKTHKNTKEKIDYFSKDFKESDATRGIYSEALDNRKKLYPQHIQVVHSPHTFNHKLT